MNKQFWKIKNLTTKPVNFVLPLPGSGSKGVLLNPGECIISECTIVNGIKQKTATLGVQERRGLIEIQDNFNNTLYNLETGINLTTATVDSKIKLVDAQKDVENYME